jgi:hypothetical protein
LIKRRMQPATRIRTLSVPNPDVDEHHLRAVEQTYLHRYFRPQTEIEREFEARRPATRASTTRIRDLTQE